MAKLNEIRFFLLVSLMIFSTQALKVFLANDKGTYNIHTKIIFGITNGAKVYLGGSHDRYTLAKDTLKVILYIVSHERFSEIMQTEHNDERMEISNTLRIVHYELFYFGIDGFVPSVDESLIRNFILDTINQSDPILIAPFRIIGNISLLVTRVLPNLSEETDFTKYIENPQVFKEKLQVHLEAIGKQTLCGLITFRK